VHSAATTFRRATAAGGQQPPAACGNPGLEEGWGIPNARENNGPKSSTRTQVQDPVKLDNTSHLDLRDFGLT
jgi:hypothetical protein